MFKLINLTTNEYLRNERTSLTFEEGAKAARAAKLATVILKTKVQVRRAADDGDGNWRERERARLTNGEYTPLADAFASWSRLAFPDHFAHVAKKRPGLVAYTKDEERGKNDVQSLMSIEAYADLIGTKQREFERYKEGVLRQHREYASIMNGAYKLATTPDEIERVYTNYGGSTVSGSCMRYRGSHWRTVDGVHYHPARIYGAGDLAVAYIDDDDGKTLARALIWPEQKLYSRVYADNDTLHRLLKADGYKQSSYYDDDNPSLEGARMLRVFNDSGNLVCPYLDEVGTVTDDGEYLIFEGPIGAQQTDGQTQDADPDPEDQEICEGCGDAFDPDDMRTVYTAYRGRRAESWCLHCRETDTFYCEGTNAVYADSVDHTYVNSEAYCDRYLEDNATLCERNREWTFDPVTVIVDADGTTEQWCPDAADEHAYQYGGQYFSDDIESTEAVIERYVPVRQTKWVHGHDAALPCWLMPARSGKLYHMGNKEAWVGSCLVPHNVWFVDKIGQVPDHLLDEHFMVGLDGRRYLRGYRDNYPVDRARMDIDLITYLDLKEAA